MFGKKNLVGVAPEQSGVAEITAVLADITIKAGNGTFTLNELKRFAKRENPFSPARLSKKQREEWGRFYRDEFSLELDLSSVTAPDNPGDFDRLVVVAQGITIAQVIAVCRKHFKVWVYREDLDAAVTENERIAENDHYAIRVRDVIEADEELKNLSANNIKERGIATETLLERLLHELKSFKETGDHLDRKMITLCAGSRFSDGDVPHVLWYGSGMFVYWFDPDDADDGLRARQAVS